VACASDGPNCSVFITYSRSSGGTLEENAKKKTGKTMQELIDEKRKELDEKVKNRGDENIKIRANQVLP
jgi:hypothetical protein